MSDRLATYLHDHLAGSNFAVDLPQQFIANHAATALGDFATGLLLEIEEDRRVLHSLIERVGGAPPVLKEAAAWVAEKASRLKLSTAAAGELGTFQALETLAPGILGKLALWQALGLIAGSDARLQGADFAKLSERAESQHAQVEQRRLQAARPALMA